MTDNVEIMGIRRSGFMGIKQRFMVMIGLVVLLLAAVSGIGYYMAQSILSDSVKSQLTAIVKDQGSQLDTWIESKAAILDGVGNALSKQSAEVSTTKQTLPYLGAIAGDKEILDLTSGSDSGNSFSYVDGDITNDFDARTRDWYKDAKNTGNALFTEAYVSLGGSSDGKIVISYAVPLKADSGKTIGALCEDIDLSVLENVVKKVNYEGQGTGIIIDKKGQIIASSGEEKVMSLIHDDKELTSHYDAMLAQPTGYFEISRGGETEMFAYTTLERPGWIVGLFVPKDYVFASLTKLKIVYTVLCLLGLILITIGGAIFTKQITSVVVRLKNHAVELSQGNLAVADLEVTSNDELGDLTNSFNTMKAHLHALIKQMSSVSEQVAAASEELTAGAHQSAEASTNVAETITKIAEGMQNQNNSIDEAKKEVDAVFTEMQAMTDNTKLMADTSNDTAIAAKTGEQLMNNAMQKMEHIESSVMSSADTVRILGENSKEIGAIVETIVAIADQTNLLALNAAIEAARAGEAGKGFAVVAEEVRKLAAESQTSAEKIKEKISSIQVDTNQAVIAMQEGTVEVQAGTEAINEVGRQFKDIMQKVSDIKTQIDAFHAASSRITNGAERIVGAVDSIDEVSRETASHTETISAAAEQQSASSAEIASSSDSLAKMASELQNATNKFKL
ncbi:methyl-accepting chemotaxis protein [Selenomonas sp. WCA-380-WT-3B 3/]|uniref:Methyl-accepting chemotaxis protein n=1 Tax=Selenomonas montiformis TaxID=2652285 RepID=A0A6I2V0K8_9FIRM|nr:methyl-accepting chemotaxis protein [Selenomonas montiformis]MSV25076.1 methyl-accepting chemotaxis protein [Selenomonas montiformis]